MTKYQHFKGVIDTLAFVESELIATLEDDAARLDDEADADTIEELQRKVEDIGLAFAELGTVLEAAGDVAEHLQRLIDGAQLVIERWEGGDLADAVNSLRADMELAREVCPPFKVTKPDPNYTESTWKVQPLQADHGATIAIVDTNNGYVRATIPMDEDIQTEDHPNYHTVKRHPDDLPDAFKIAAVPSLLELARRIKAGYYTASKSARQFARAVLAEAEPKEIKF